MCSVSVNTRTPHATPCVQTCLEARSIKCEEGKHLQGGWWWFAVVCGGDDSGQTPQSLGLCCVHIKLFYKLVGRCLSDCNQERPGFFFFFFFRAQRRRAVRVFASLCCFNYQSAAQRQEALCSRDERLLSRPHESEAGSGDGREGGWVGRGRIVDARGEGSAV